MSSTKKLDPKVITCICSCQNISIAEIAPTTNAKPIQLSIPQRYNKLISYHQYIQSVTCNHMPQEQYLPHIYQEAPIAKDNVKFVTNPLTTSQRSESM